VFVVSHLLRNNAKIKYLRSLPVGHFVYIIRIYISNIYHTKETYFIIIQQFWAKRLPTNLSKVDFTFTCSGQTSKEFEHTKNISRAEEVGLKSKGNG